MPASVTASLSVSHFINSVGAKAGFASIIGLAILVLLYFAHARETASLRDQLAESAQRIASLEARVQQLGRGSPPAAAASGQTAVAGRPAPAPAGARPAAAGAPAAAAATAAAPSRVARPTPSPVSAAGAAAAGAGAAAAATALADPPLAPAGVGAPPLSDATRLIPEGVPQVQRAAAEQPVPPAAQAPTPVPAAGNGSGARSQQTITPPPRVRIGGTGPAQPGRRQPIAPPRQPPPSGSSRGRTILFGIIGLLVVAAVAVILIVVTSSGGSTTSASSTASQTSNAPVVRHHRARPKTAAFNPASVTVSVLNGTPTAGRAHRVAVKLQGSGFKLGKVATATDQTHTATVVAYLPGFHGDAVRVAALLKLGPASAAPIDPSTQALACPAGSPCTVVVTVGSDLTTIP